MRLERLEEVLPVRAFINIAEDVKKRDAEVVLPTFKEGLGEDFLSAPRYVFENLRPHCAQAYQPIAAVGGGAHANIFLSKALPRGVYVTTGDVRAIGSDCGDFGAALSEGFLEGVGQAGSQIALSLRADFPAFRDQALEGVESKVGSDAYFDIGAASQLVGEMAQ